MERSATKSTKLSLGASGSVRGEELPPLVSSEELAGLPLGTLLGRGESAEVYGARADSGTPLALKIARPGAEEALLREARLLALVEGAPVPQLLGVARRDGRVVLALSLAAGESLDQILARDPSQEERATLARLLLSVAPRALAHLHAFRRAHGDVKPENLFVDTVSGSVTLIDLGLSDPGGEIRGGTPRYLPPEVKSGSVVAQAAADVYALGVVLLEVLAPEVGDEVPELWHLKNLAPAWGKLLSVMLLGAPGLRPTMDFVSEEARWLGLVPFESETGGLSVLRRHYIAVRALDFLSTRGASGRNFPEGLPGAWLRRLVELEDRILEVESGRGVTSRRGTSVSTEGISCELSAHDRSRFLARLIGPHAADYRIAVARDEELIETLLSVGKGRDFRSLIRADFERENGAGEEAVGDGPIEWALSLGRSPVSRVLLRRILESKEAPDVVRLKAARKARQQGDLRLASQLLLPLEGPEAVLARALVLNRSGASAKIADLLESVLESTDLPQVSSRAAALLARGRLDAGDAEGALHLLESRAPTASSCEVMALSFLALTDPERALACVRSGEAFATDDEETARLFGVRGMIEHQQGEAQAALLSFSRAVALASREGAALEEATYLTGVAAAAADAGQTADALAASERAEVLFESLEKGMHTARALLSRAAVLSRLGAEVELASVVRRGSALAQSVGDQLCEAYLALAWADGSSERVTSEQAARRASELIGTGSLEDRLRVGARLLFHGIVPEGATDESAEKSASREAAFDWWAARTRAVEEVERGGRTETSHAESQYLIGRLLSFSVDEISPAVLGPGMVAGAHLALRVGLSEEARALFSRARVTAERFLSTVPEAYRTQCEDLLWVKQARGSRADGPTGSTKLEDVEALLRALSQRRGFRALLDQVLDMLLLWTGVERGLLLLPAPGDKLVVRAARNLDRRSLTEEQRTLSFSMARRALSEGRPVVAVDAMHDLSQIHKSVHALNLRSVLAVPLAARGKVVGVAYLDDRIRRGAFGEAELSWVSLIATVAALAISDERDRIQLRRAVGRAERAERSLEKKLSNREVQLEVAEREISRIRGEGALRGTYDQIIGRSPKMMDVLRLVDRVSQADVPVMIYGESGTGKELVARAIAQTGGRKERPFVAENCASVPESLLESALFGHKRGSFTGATRDQPGLFELAHGGTLFLDEIGDMPLTMQAKLLRVLADGEVRPLGAARSIKVDVRLIVATHRDLEILAKEGQFREDLYYRLKVVSVFVPPLRERREDIPVLVAHFVKRYGGGRERPLSPAALSRLCNFSWPGNVRQLENEIRRLLVLGGQELTAADLSPEVLSDSSDLPQARTLREKVDALERRLVVEALEQARGNQTRAAEALGLSRFGLSKMTQRLAIDVSKSRLKAGRIQQRGLDDSR